MHTGTGYTVGATELFRKIDSFGTLLPKTHALAKAKYKVGWVRAARLASPHFTLSYVTYTPTVTRNAKMRAITRIQDALRKHMRQALHEDKNANVADFAFGM